MITQAHPSTRTRLAALLAVFPLATLAAEPAATVPAAPESGSPTHVLFTGTDIQIMHGGTLHRVRGVDGASFIVVTPDRTVSIPMRDNPETIKLSQVQLLANRFATVTQFKYDRVYTPENDPYRKFSKDAMAATGMNEVADFAEVAVAKTPRTLTVTGMFGVKKEVENPVYQQAERNLNAANQRSGGNMGSISTYADRLTEELARELFDAVEVRFEISAAKPVQHPYVVVMARFHEKDDPKHARNWLMAKELDPIGSTPQTVVMREAGFPPGFIVEKLQVHLYENGEEIATDLSTNRAMLSREEAHEYLVIEYVSTHKNDSAKPIVVMAEVPPSWLARRAEDAFKHTYYVKVDKTGRAAGVFHDEPCAKPAAASEFTNVLNGLLFYPALAKGKPVDGLVRIRPGELAR